MIEVTLNELLNVSSVMQELAKKPMKVKAAYKTAKMLNAIEKEYQLFQDARTKLIEKYGQRGDDGNLKIDENGNYSVSNENLIAFNKELNEMLEEKVTLNANPLNVEELEEANFTPADMIALTPFMSDDE